jgi:hypothetical protein
MSNISNNQDSANGVNTAFGGNNYFKAENEEITFLGAKNTPYTKLKPKGNGIVDVYKDMYWSNLGNKSEVPQIFVVEKELKYGVWATQLSNLLTEGGKFAGGVGAAAANNFGADVNVKNVDSSQKT